ncbi:hypothetical protein PINS_up010591 [Pythium insidiosum]|nr:hypothetical protein PINS_up010591 [Pythium insidiosum]
MLARLVTMLLLPLVLVVQAEDAGKPLPWDGRVQNLTVDTLSSKYMTHILTMRNSSAAKLSDYVAILPEGRQHAVNGDKGVVRLSVDDTAIFKAQHNFRRSELVQIVQDNRNGTTLFRVSLRAPKRFTNRHVWQVVFPESHQWEVFINATASPPELQFRVESDVQYATTVAWRTPLEIDTWYNFGIAVKSSGMKLYASEGHKAPHCVYKGTRATKIPETDELHIGLLTLSGTDAPPTMTGKDSLDFSGVSVEKRGAQ